MLDTSLSFKEKVDSFRKLIVSNELKKNNNNQTLTAKKLKIDRTTLIRILEK